MMPGRTSVAVDAFGDRIAQALGDLLDARRLDPRGVQVVDVPAAADDDVQVELGGDLAQGCRSGIDSVDRQLDDAAPTRVLEFPAPRRG